MLDPDYSTFDFLYISLGAGVQSTALYLMSSTEDRVPRAAAAIFADTEDEPPWVYENLERLKVWAKANDGIPIHVVGIGCLSDDTAEKRDNGSDSFVAVPAFTVGDTGRETPLRRQCTREYKIQPIEKKVRALMGYKARQVIKEHACAMIGISFEEISRVRDSPTRWVTNAHPLVDARLRRNDCIDLVLAHGLPEPRKSSCTFCPYHSDRFWKDLRDNHADLWADAVGFDSTIRNMGQAGADRPLFLHRSLVPLDAVAFDETGDLFSMEYGSCDGYCDT